jgi:hypothetical protein
VSQLPPPPPFRPTGDRPLPIPLSDHEAESGAQAPQEVVAPPKIAAPPLPAHSREAPRPADEEPSWWSSGGRVESSAWLVSLVVHAVAIFLLGLITLSVRSGGPSVNLLASAADGEPGSAAIDQTPSVVEPNPQSSKNTAASQDPALDAAPVEVLMEDPKVVMDVRKPERLNNNRPAAPGGNDDARASEDAPAGQGLSGGGGWGGRDLANRGKTAMGSGGTKKSEEAVERGLQWLAAHQREDGSWCFDLGKPPCNGMCRNSGSESSTTAATGLALLPFLGAGYTQMEGKHQETVKKGLYYLTTRAVVTQHGVDLQDGGTMYAQGIATLALCEAYGMTGDKSLKDVAQGAIRYIVYAQNLDRGGWRYTPGAPGDTTVTGWQLMALKSGQMARLEVPSPTIGLVKSFLDGVQFDRGSRYGYLTPEMRAPTQETTTAVGLLCRMYLGWNRGKQALYRGVEHLHKWKFSKTNMYYDYYATQVMHHWQGPEWQAWNKPMREYLIATQATESHESGSWYFSDPYGNAGGRLYNTAMAIMILEVYYRHMPLYGEKAVKGEF